MNDQHTHAGYAGYDASQTGSYPAGPLYGTYPDEQGVAPGSGYDSDFTAVPTPAQHGTYPGQDTSYAAGSSWASGTHDGGHTGGHTGAHTGTYAGYADESGAAHHHPYDTTGSWPTSPAGSPDGTGQWDSSGWQQAATHTTTGQWAFTDTGAFPTTTFESALYGTGTYPAATATGTYENHGGENHGGYDGTGYAPAPSAYGTDAPHYGPTAYATGACDTGTFDSRTFEASGYDTTAYDSTAYDTPTHGTPAYGNPVHDTPASGIPAYAATAFATGAYDSGAYDATAWNSAPEGPDATPGATAYIPEQMSYPSDERHRADSEHLTPEHAEPEHRAPEQHGSAAQDGFAQDDAPQDTESGAAQEPGPESEDPAAGLPDSWPDPYTPDVRTDGRTDVRTEGRSAARNRNRRRAPAKRSALLTIAVPSACVMGVAGIAAASVGGLGRGEETKDDTTTMAAADTGAVKALASNTKLDTQLAGVDAAGADFRDRASRTQERIDLKERQAAEKKKREEEAARKEAARPKYLLPVAQHGLSAYFGQAGVNWMSVHTGIDFPVQYGTPVMAATDGTVRTQWNSAYGNMAIVTMEDGTETWYCHLSSTKIRSGSVKAGDVIAYSGSSGNSTGPHLHFEVRPGGGSAVNPLPWLASHGLDPQ